jgi:tetratricopeptide (TPR) repeat protein
MFQQWVRSLPEHWRHLPPYLKLYAALLIGTGLLFQLAYPIVLADSDMWYHLDGGRYFWQHGEVPNHAFFSFIEPERLFVNYYWGFQALLAKIHEYAGYQGLLILRALLFTLTTLLAYRFIIEERARNYPVLLFFLLFIAYFTLIEGRLPNLRPHLFSHLFILLFLYILERRPAWAPALPLITVVWSNVHGIEYPVPVLIGGAYFVEIVYVRLIRKSQDGERGWREALWLLACAPALLLTPHGWDLLSTPFTVSPFVSLYIQEMKTLKPELLYSVLLSGDNLKVESVFPLAFIFCTFAIVRGLLDRSLRISHAILALGAYLLLVRGNRFVWEWALLVLPLLTHYSGSLQAPHSGRKLLSALHLLMILAMCLPFVSMAKRLPQHADYPFEASNAPVGVVRFLQQTGTGGKLFSPPSTAGFMHWELGSEFRIYADLQMSLFNDLDVYSLYSFYRDVNGMGKILTRFQPDYIAVDQKNAPFKKRLEERGEYVPVFAGDKQVLYANRQTRPQIAERYELKLVNPFSLAQIGDDIALDDHIAELAAMLEIYPQSRRILHTITLLLFDEKRFEEALPWVERFVRYHPENANSHYLLGNIYENTGRCVEAIGHYNRSKRYADTEFNLVLDNHIGSCYYVLQDFAAAYTHLGRSLNPYAKTRASADLYQLAFSAFIQGETEEAVLLLKMLLHDAPEEKGEIASEAEALLQTLREHDSQTPSFFEWLWHSATGLFSSANDKERSPPPAQRDS